MERLRKVAKEYQIRSEPKLRALAIRLGYPTPPKEIKEALATNVAKQLLAPAVPQAQGKSASEGIGSRYQADLIDFAINGNHRTGHKYGLVVTDVFSRKAWARPMPDKSSSQVADTFKEIENKVPGHFQNAVVSTDAGGEFARLQDELPEGSLRRTAAPSDYNKIAVVDSVIKNLKVNLADQAINRGDAWSHVLPRVARRYNEVPQKNIHGAPETMSDEGPQQFLRLQDMAGAFAHNRGLTLARKAAIEETGGTVRPRKYNANRSFRAAYGPKESVRVLPGGYEVENEEGKRMLLKHVRPVPAASEEAMSHLTIPLKQRALGPKKLNLPGNKLQISMRPRPKSAPPQRIPSSGSGLTAAERADIPTILPKPKMTTKERFGALRGIHEGRYA